MYVVVTYLNIKKLNITTYWICKWQTKFMKIMIHKQLCLRMMITSRRALSVVY